MNSTDTSSPTDLLTTFPQTVACYGESISAQRYIVTQLLEEVETHNPFFYMSPYEPEQFLSFVSEVNESLLQKMTVHTARSMTEQQQTIDRLRMGYENIGGIVVDPFTTHYRLDRTAISNGFRPDGIETETTESQAISQLERQLLTQTQQLYLIAYRRDVPLIITNEAYYHTDEECVYPLGGELANRWYDTQYEINTNSHAGSIEITDVRDERQQNISVPAKYHTMIGEL